MDYRDFTHIAGRACLLAFFLSSPARADRERHAHDEDRSLSPHFFVEGGDPAIDRMPLDATEVVFNVTGVIADVVVRQLYRNDGTRPISARYVFPASTRAAVHGMRMTVGETRIEAEIREREEAKHEYEVAKDAGKTASLLEQERPNVFSMRVANVMPGDRIEVELRYSELLVPTDGTYEFVYPTVVGPRYASSASAAASSDGGTDDNDWVASPYLREDREPTSSFALRGRLATGVPVQQLAVPSHQVQQRWQGPAQVELQLADAERGGGDRDFVLRYQLMGKQVESGLLLYEGDDENFFLLTLQPPERVDPAHMPPREYVFVLDVSGSMHGFPLDTAKRVMRDLVADLRAQDSFNVLLFSGDSYVLWPRSRPATPDNLAQAIAVIDNQPGSGGTDLLSAMRNALALPLGAGHSRNFVVVTDGYISAERDVFTFIRKHLGEANVYSFGIGSSVNRYLIDGVARAGMGEAFVILEPSESSAVAARFKQYIAAPILTDIALATEGVELFDVEPAAFPDLLAERPLVIHGKWRGPVDGSAGRVRVTGTSGAGAYRQDFDFAKTAPDPRNRALSRLWARTRIANVSDFSFGNETDAERAQLIELGLRYNLLTKHTSFIAVAHRVRNTSGGSDEVDQPLPLPLGVSDLAVGDPAEAMYGAPEPELWLLLALFALLLGLSLRSRRSAGVRQA